MATNEDDRPGTPTPRDRAPTPPEGDVSDRTDAEQQRAAEAPDERERTPFTQQLGRVLVAVILVLFGIFAVANAQPVAFDWVFGQTDVEQVGEQVSGGVPLILLLLASFVLGALAGWFATWRSGRRS